MSNDLIQTIATQEQTLILPRFSADIAYQLGSTIYQEAKKKKLAVTIDVRQGDHILFHTAMEGTTANNDNWVRRKSNTVQLTHKSSFRVGLENKAKGTTLADSQALPLLDYADHGGAFPLRTRDSGFVGVVTVSGLPQEQDHQLVVDGLSAFLPTLGENK
ncbi:MAG: heme-degrading domain-containing protein [Spirochaetales bacterium]|nr:heme-degrading domain-containing protein [Spirochaetales bacterium]